MRTTRLLLLALFCFLAILIIFSAPRRSDRIYTDSRIQHSRKKTGIRALFSFRTPLFPSSAIISLTDDNSTFFLSRPAAFGPLLPRRGLSGQLWIGSGFGEDPRGWVGAERIPEGELGCSDVPGWDENLTRLDRALLDGSLNQKTTGSAQKKTFTAKENDRLRRSTSEDITEDLHRSSNKGSKDDGTDDGTDDYLHQPLVETASISNSDSAADLKSLQESAEIAGRIVLLSRGGCGFLEKVKWVQRRGGLGLIVGDNIPGGALVTMYAKGDTSDVTIPAIFTSHTTAHLLSSLIPPNGLIGSEAPTSKHDGWFKSQTPSAVAPSGGHISHNSGFFKRLLSFLGLSGHYLNDATSSTTNHGANDDFVIGVQDWRDPAAASTSRELSSGAAQKEGAGKAEKRILSSRITSAHRENSKDDAATESPTNRLKNSNSQLGHSNGKTKPPAAKYVKKTSSKHESATMHEEANPHHEGLWVTLTPTSMSSSPFFDTILVLVISPLITLTVVYAVLLIRSRIRRRRWRAPKSVVERLPVRTYQTIPSSGASTTALATPVASSPSTPLLQHTSATLRPPPMPRSRSHSRNRPQSRTASEVRSPLPNDSEDEEENTSMTESEKREKGLAEWRRRYGGRQKECVVCLEEYIDGVSQVMSLPCGHEFHVDCITPWLTTRRRTCPICKGDVVRSMARQDGTSSSSRNRLDSAEDSDEDADSIQTRAALLRNDSGSAQEPVPVESEDVERGFTRDAGEGGVIDWFAERWEQGRQVFADWRSGRGWRLGRRVDNEVDRDR